MSSPPLSWPCMPVVGRSGLSWASAEAYEDTCPPIPPAWAWQQGNKQHEGDSSSAWQLLHHQQQALIWGLTRAWIATDNSGLVTLVGTAWNIVVTSWTSTSVMCALDPCHFVEEVASSFKQETISMTSNMPVRKQGRMKKVIIIVLLLFSSV